MWVTMVTKVGDGVRAELLQAMGHLSSHLLLPRLLGAAAGRRATVPGRPPRQGWDRPRWAPTPQCCRGPGRGPVGTQRPAGATHLGTQSLARPAAPEAEAQGLSALQPAGTGRRSRAELGSLTTLLQPSLSPPLSLLSSPVRVSITTPIIIM